MELQHAIKKLFIGLTLKYIYYSFMRSEIYKNTDIENCRGRGRPIAFMKTSFHVLYYGAGGFSTRPGHVRTIASVSEPIKSWDIL
jgi:hypothetical protein